MIKVDPQTLVIIVGKFFGVAASFLLSDTENPSRPTNVGAVTFLASSAVFDCYLTYCNAMRKEQRFLSFFASLLFGCAISLLTYDEAKRHESFKNAILTFMASGCFAYSALAGMAKSICTKQLFPTEEVPAASNLLQMVQVPVKPTRLACAFVTSIPSFVLLGSLFLLGAQIQAHENAKQVHNENALDRSVHLMIVSMGFAISAFAGIYGVTRHLSHLFKETVVVGEPQDTPYARYRPANTRFAI